MEAPPKIYCRAAKIPLRELAKRAGISPTLLYDYCRGRCRMSDRSYLAVSRASGGEIRAIDLMTWRPEESEPTENQETDPRPAA